MLEVLLSNGLCFINAAILCKEHIIFFTSLAKNLSMPNKEIGEKLPFYSYGSTGWFAWYSITKGSKLEEANVLSTLLVSLPWGICTEIPAYSKGILVWEWSACSLLFTCSAYVNFIDWASMYSA